MSDIALDGAFLPELQYEFSNSTRHAIYIIKNIIAFRERCNNNSNNMTIVFEVH